MTTLQLKSELHKLIDSADDMGLLKAIRTILKQKSLSTTRDFWDLLPDDIKASIDNGIAQANNGELISHENMVAETKSKYQLK